MPIVVEFHFHACGLQESPSRKPVPQQQKSNLHSVSLTDDDNSLTCLVIAVSPCVDNISANHRHERSYFYMTQLHVSQLQMATLDGNSNEPMKRVTQIYYLHIEKIRFSDNAT